MTSLNPSSGEKKKQKQKQNQKQLTDDKEYFEEENFLQIYDDI